MTRSQLSRTKRRWTIEGLKPKRLVFLGDGLWDRPADHGRCDHGTLDITTDFPYLPSPLSTLSCSLLPSPLCLCLAISIVCLLTTWSSHHAWRRHACADNGGGVWSVIDGTPSTPEAAEHTHRFGRPGPAQTRPRPAATDAQKGCQTPPYCMSYPAGRSIRAAGRKHTCTRRCRQSSGKSVFSTRGMRRLLNSG